EIEVLKLIANGKDNAVIAAELHISPKTVTNHISNILLKLQIDNRIQAAVYAVRSGIVYAARAAALRRRLTTWRSWRSVRSCASSPSALSRRSDSATSSAATLCADTSPAS